jgi:putative ABC transport system permease protein
MSIFRFAWRNVWRNKRRTVATVSAMSLALLVMILYSGIINGYLVGMERDLVELEMGDMQIHAKDYRQNPSIYTRIPHPKTLILDLEKRNFRASARLLAAGLAAKDDSSGGVTLRGIDPRQDALVSLVYREVEHGKWLDEHDPKGVVLGRRLAKTLNAEPGDEIVILTQGADGSMANDLYTVRGTLKGVGDVTDRTGVFMTTAAFRDLMVIPDGAHQIIVRKPAEQALETSAVSLGEATTDLDAKTWRELVPAIASMFDSAQSMIYIMSLIIYIAVGIVILNAMLMAVFERIREFGVLKAIGMGPGHVLRLILVESTIQTGMALVIGLILSIPSNWYLVNEGIDLGGFTDISVAGMTMDSTMRAIVDTNTYVVPIMTLIVVVFISVLYPAVKAAVISPIEAIHHQ